MKGITMEVCKEWLIREDGNLAYRLQSEEITQHYHGNRSKNRIVREDLPLAKHLQESELNHAQRIRANHERYANDQMTNDEKIAYQLQRRIWHEEEKMKRTTEEADERLAMKLVQKEKARQLRKRLEKEKLQVEKLSAQIGTDYGVSLESVTSDESSIPSTPPSYQRILTEDDQELDLSDLICPPPPGLTPDEMKYFLEEQDAEIARLLQRQELKRNKNPKKEKLAIIEAQDHELARMLQKMEKERVKRIKEKLRAKQNQQPGAEGSVSNFSIGPTDNINFQRTSTPISPHTSLNETQFRTEENEYDIPENHLLGKDPDSTYEEPYQVLSQQNEARLQQPFYNIAMALDPTYQRRFHSRPDGDGDPDAFPVESNCLESCVDDEEASVVCPPSALAKSNDSLERVQRIETKAEDEQRQQVTSTTSSRSSQSSSSSGHSVGNRSVKSNQSADNQRNYPFGDINIDHEEYAPPLPPRHVSLLGRNKLELAAEPQQKSPHANILPPHHPQHPNRRSMDTSQHFSPNRVSVYSTSSASGPVQGHRRTQTSMEKPKKEKHKSQDGCRTQ